MASEDNKQDAELDEAFARLEKQVADNQATENEKGDETEQATVSEKSTSGTISRKTPKAPEASGQGSGFTGVLSLLFALVALGLGSYGAYTSWLLNESKAGSAAEVQTLNSEIASLNDQISQLQTNQTGASDLLKAELESFSAKQQADASDIETRIANSVAELRQQIGTTSEDWLLAEAEYLLRLANQRVLMEDDVAGAISLFEAADKIISEAEGVVAFSLREAIANDIATLKALSQTDVDGIFVQLGAVAAQVPALGQKKLSFESEVGPAPAAEQDRTLLQATQHLLQRFGARLASLVDFRRDGEVVTPILPPNEEYYLKQNLLLKIQLAQLGLLRGNQEIYAQSLGDASAWVNQYFDLESPRTVSVATTLGELSGRQVEREKPDVSSSLREIRKLMANFHEAAGRSES